MPKRAADSSPNPPKRGRRKKNAPETGGEGGENDEDLLHQMKRRAIIEAKDDEEEWIREMEQEEGGHYLDDIYIPPKITRTEHPFTGERLVIEKIVCENFKSYGGIKEMGCFHKSFSAIIGPNGNGKSNVIDAMLFVFGYRASKIRCKKVSTLIHNSELLPNLRSCAVTVHFYKIIDDGDKVKEGADDFQIVEGSKIAVKRRALSDNSSKYYLNGKCVKFQEIAKFLKSNGVDLTHNRFLILQGEVEQIAQLPPIGSNGNDGLLEFLEDVIGTRRYIRPLAQLEERVEKLDYERDEKLQRVGKAEKEKAALTEPVKKAKEYLGMQNSKITYQNILFQKQKFIANQKLVEKEKIKVEVEGKMTILQERLDKLLATNKKRREELKDAEREYKSSEKEYAKVKKKFDAADAEFIQLNQELQRTNETRKKLKKEEVKLQEDIEKQIGIPDTHKRDIEQLTKRKLELDTDIEKEDAAVKGDLAKLNVQVEAALKMKEVTDRQFAEQKTLRDEKKAAMEKLQKQLAKSQEREGIEKNKLAKIEEDLEKLKETIGKKDKEGRTSLGISKVATMETKMQELLREEKELQNVEAAKRTVFETARDEFQTAQAALDGNSQMDRVDRALLEAKADGTLEGLYGRLKNLAKIPEKYNIAATASTNQLEHWIADTDDTAQKCIEFLRKNDLPFQNFGCLSKLQHYKRQAQDRFDTPAQSHRIFDLLEISDPVLIPAYYKAFRNTLVAENIDTATKVSYGGSRRHRVATLKGEIVEPTGSLVGGGNGITVGKLNSKKAAITVTKQQLNALKKRHDDAVKEYQTAQEACQVATQNARKLMEEIEDIKRKSNNFASDMAALKAQLPLKEANLQTLRKNLKEIALTPAVLKAKEAEIQQAVGEFDDMQEPFEEAEENAKRINQKVQDLDVTKKKEITKKLDKFKDQCKKVEAELNKKIVELKNCETNRKKSEKKLESTQQEIQNLQKMMEKKNERRLQVEAEAKEIKDIDKELSAKVEAAKKVFDDLNSHSNENQKEENSLTKEKLCLENKLQDATNEMKGCQNYVRNLDENRKKLKLYDIPEEDVVELKEFTDEEIRAYSITELERKVQKHTENIKKVPTPNLNILDEYRDKIEMLLERIKELDMITTQRDKFREAYCLLDQQRSTEFMEGFALISSRLKEMFRMISMGGDAELEVVDTLDLFGCGINFSVRPARKTWKKISNLSGGEKTLSSLSLVFALHHFKPSPFYVMDEIDAALDFKNVSIIANYIKDRTKFTQFIIISLRSNMFELADSLLGVFKVDNMSYCIHIGVKKIVEELRRKLRGRNPTGNNVPSSQGGPMKESQPHQDVPIAPLSQHSPPPRIVASPVAGTSKAALLQLLQHKQKFPEIDVSIILDEHLENIENEDAANHSASPKSPTVVENTMVQKEQDSSFTPPGRISDTPCAAQQAAIEDNDGSVDMFEGMEIDESPMPTPIQGRRSLPKYTSTPFVGKGPTAAPPRNQGGGFISDEDDEAYDDAEHEDGVANPTISPIKGIVPNRLQSPGLGSDDDSFKTAEDSEAPGSDIDEIGPTQE